MKFYIYKNGNKINTIVSNEDFVIKYCQNHRYTYDIVEEIIRESIEDDSLSVNNEITREDEIDFMLIDHEYRLTLHELGVNE